MPWFGGVRGIWYRKDQFTKAGITSPPASWAQLVADAKLLQKKFPGTWGLGAPSDYTNAIVSFIWGAGGQVAVDQGGKWVAELNSPQSEAGIKFYADLYLTDHVSPKTYVGQTELGAPGATSGGSNEDFALGKLDMYIDGPWAKAEFPKNAVDSANFASFPIPGQQQRPVAGLRGRLRPGGLEADQVPHGRLGPGQDDGQRQQLHLVRQRAGVLPAVHLPAHRRRLQQQPAARPGSRRRRPSPRSRR